MQKNRLLLLILCLVLPRAAQAESAMPAIYDECTSANPPGDFAAIRKRCAVKATAERTRVAGLAGAATAGAPVKTVYEARGPIASLNFSSVPTWSDADILAQFAATRDKRYIPDNVDPQPNPRRITWLYPNDGCFDRAEQVNVLVANAGKQRPAKLFVFSENPKLHVVTDNDEDGFVEWKFHVVPVVKNSAGQPIVFDAAINPCRPMHYMEWLRLMTDDLSIFDNYLNGGAVVASTWAYNGDSPVTGDLPHQWETHSFTNETAMVVDEWFRQQNLGRDPNVVLGASPPWSGYGCLKTFTVDQFTVLPLTGTRTITATCPFGTLNVGGGFGIDPGVRVSKDARNGNGWDVTATNTGTGFGSLQSQAVCLQGAPSNAAISSVQGNVVGVANNAFGTSTANCGNQTLVGGGYTTTVSGSPATAMRIYSNQRSTTSNSTWQASAYNLTGATRNVTAFAYCMQSAPNFTYSQASATVDAGGNAAVTCAASKVALGGGWSFPRTSAYSAISEVNTSSKQAVTTLSPAPGGAGDANSKGYVECLTHP